MPSRMPFLVPDQNQQILLFCKCDGIVEYQTGLKTGQQSYKDFPWRIWARNLATNQEYMLNLPSFPENAIDMRPATFLVDGTWNLVFVRRFKEAVGGHTPYACKTTTQDWVTFSEPKRIFARVSPVGFMNSKYILCDERPSMPGAPTNASAILTPETDKDAAPTPPPPSKTVFLVERKTGVRVDIKLGMRQIETCTWIPGDEEQVVISGLNQDNIVSTLVVALALGSAKEINVGGTPIRDFTSFGGKSFYASGRDQFKISVSEGTSEAIDAKIPIDIKRN